MRLSIRNNRFGITKGRHFYKLQLGQIRLYISFIPLKPKYESATRRSFRKRLLERSDRCAFCNRQLNLSTLSVHHIKPRHLYPELVYDYDNCQCLCRQCHTEYHRLDSLKKAGRERAVNQT